MQTTLRTVGGLIAMTIPKAIVDELGLKPDAKVDLVVEDGSLVVTASKRPKYKLDDLLAQCDADAPRDPELDEWLNMPSVGREIIIDDVLARPTAILE
jgi:antitoxin ChpS